MSDDNTEPKWFIDEGIAGQGERPSWLPEKFKTVADMSRSYHELEKRFGNAPEDYDFSKSKYIDPNYAPFQDLKQVLKEKRVPQEVVDRFIEANDKYMDEFRTDEAEEIKKLGENGPQRLEVLNNWAKANLSKEAYEALTSNMKTAESIKAIEEIRGKMMSNNPVVPNGNDNAGVAGSTIGELKDELSTNLEKYKTDAKYRDDLQRRMAIAAKNVPGYVDKIGS